MPSSAVVPKPPPLVPNGAGTDEGTKEASLASIREKSPGEKSTRAARIDSLRAGRFRQLSGVPSVVGSVTPQEHSQLKIKLHHLEAQLKVEVDARARLSAEHVKKLKELQAECDEEREKLHNLQQEHAEACDLLNELENENKSKIDAEKFTVEFEKLLTELGNQEEKIVVLEERIVKYKLDEQRNDALLKANRRMEERLNKATDECERVRTTLEHENKMLSTRMMELVEHNAWLVKAEEELRDGEEKLKLSLTIEKQNVKFLELEKESLLQENKSLKKHMEANEEEVRKLNQTILELKQKNLARSVTPTGRLNPGGALYDDGSDGATVRGQSEAFDTPHETGYNSDDSLETEIDRLFPDRIEILQSIAGSPPPEFASEITVEPVGEPIPATETVAKTIVQTAAEAISDDEGSEIWDIDEPHKITPDFANRAKTPSVPSEAVLAQEPAVASMSVISAVNKPAAQSVLGPYWLANKRKDFYAGIGIPLPAQFADKAKQGQDHHSALSRKKLATVSALIDHAQPDPRDKLQAFLCNTETEENPQQTPPEPLKDVELAFLEEDIESVECSSSASHWTERNPFTIHNLPERYFEIRRIIFTDVPFEIFGISGIFAQISCGLIQSVTYDRENSLISIVFVEPLSAREQFIRWFNRGVTLPPGLIDQCDENPGKNITLGLGLFVWTPESEPLQGVLRKSIYETGATRVLALTGKVEELTVDKVQQVLISAIFDRDSPCCDLDSRDIFESIEALDDPPRMIVKFTGIRHSVLCRKFLRENKDYDGIEVRFAKDPCDYKDLTSKLKAAGVLNDPVKAQELFGTKIGTIPLVFDDSSEDPDDLPLGPQDSQFNPEFHRRNDSRFDSQLESQYLRYQAKDGKENMPGNNAQEVVTRTAPPRLAANGLKQDRKAVQPVTQPVPGSTALTRVVKEEETEAKLREMWDRGLIGERSLMAKGILPKEDPKWEAPDEEEPALPLTPVLSDLESAPAQYAPITPHQTPGPVVVTPAPAPEDEVEVWPAQADEPARTSTAPGHWSSGETHAIKAYRAAQREKLEFNSPQRLTPLTPPVAPKSAAPSSFKGEPRHFSARTLSLIGLPNKITYAELGKYIKGGPVDTIKIFEDEHAAYVIFIYARDMQAYQKFLQVTTLKIRDNRLMPMKPSQKFLNNMRLREPEEILARGWSRCIFLEGLPLGLTTEALRRDLMSMIGTKLDFQKIEVQGLCARVWTTAITTALALREKLMGHYKYTGLHISFEMDPCDAHPATINR